MHELTFKNSKLDSRNDTWNNKSSKLVRTGLTSKVDSSLIQVDSSFQRKIIRLKNEFLKREVLRRLGVSNLC